LRARYFVAVHSGFKELREGITFIIDTTDDSMLARQGVPLQRCAMPLCLRRVFQETSRSCRRHTSLFRCALKHCKSHLIFPPNFLQCGADVAAGSSPAPGSSSERSLKAAFYSPHVFDFVRALHDLFRSCLMIILVPTGLRAGSSTPLFASRPSSQATKYFPV
jgi:hypothetical protein